MKSKVKNEDCMKMFVTLKKNEMVILRIFTDSFSECKTAVRHALYWNQLLEKQSITI